jgi:hypothetical protein
MSSAGTAWGITAVMARDAIDKKFLGIPMLISHLGITRRLFMSRYLRCHYSTVLLTDLF